MVPRSPRPRVSDLTFQVYSRPIHPDWFVVKRHRRLVQEGWEADIRVVDGGHAVHWRAGEARLTEALTGPATSLPDLGLLFHSHVRHERAATIHPGGGAEYQTSFEVERCDPEVFDHLTEEATLEASPHSLLVSFATTNRLAPPSISLVRFEPRARGLSVHTFHSLPVERAIVRTHSLFEARLALPRR